MYIQTITWSNAFGDFSVQDTFQISSPACTPLVHMENEFACVRTREHRTLLGLVQVQHHEVAIGSASEDIPDLGLVALPTALPRGQEKKEDALGSWGKDRRQTRKLIISGSRNTRRPSRARFGIGLQRPGEMMMKFGRHEKRPSGMTNTRCA
jgi:hypothetical protein